MWTAIFIISIIFLLGLRFILIKNNSKSSLYIDNDDVDQVHAIDSIATSEKSEIKESRKIKTAMPEKNNEFQDVEMDLEIKPVSDGA
ncbi:MAG TPA: hypothetical protein VL832_25320, partial [Puia sp.]|nr:hypothetical protein [Puia sp.]